MWWYIPLVPEFWRQRQADLCVSQVSLVYIVPGQPGIHSEALSPGAGGGGGRKEKGKRRREKKRKIQVPVKSAIARESGLAHLGYETNMACFGLVWGVPTIKPRASKVLGKWKCSTTEPHCSFVSKLTYVRS